MNIEIISKKEAIPSFDKNMIAVKHIQYYPSRHGTYNEAEITPVLIMNILKEIYKGINLFLYLDPYGERDFMEVLSDGEWLSLACSFNQNGKLHNYYTYNGVYADTAEEVEQFDYSDKRVWTALESGGQSPVPKIQAVTDMEAGVKAVEYFIRRGELYPLIDWLHEF
mgnify:CR=1 FL=1